MMNAKLQKQKLYIKFNLSYITCFMKKDKG